MAEPTISISVRWRPVTTTSEELLDYRHVLYGYVGKGKVFNIGMAYQQSVQERLGCRSKEGCWDFIQEQGVEKFHIIVGEITTDARLTRELLGDIESLLLFEVKPAGNVKNTDSRPVRRPGMRVRCSGHWPFPQKVFWDN